MKVFRYAAVASSFTNMLHTPGISCISLLTHCIDKTKALNAYSGFVRILGPLVIDDMSWNWPEGRESLSLCRRRIVVEASLAQMLKSICQKINTFQAGIRSLDKILISFFRR